MSALFPAGQIKISDEPVPSHHTTESSVSIRGGRLRHGWREITCAGDEESERAALNARVCHLQAQTEGSPDDSVKRLKFIHAGEDYQEIYEKFLPSADNETWHARKDGALAQLYELRNNALPSYINGNPVFCFPIANRTPIRTYVDAFNTFLAKFNRSFKIENEWTSTLASNVTSVVRGNTDCMENTKLFGSPNLIYDRDSIYSHDGRNYSPKKIHFEGKAGKAKPAPKSAKGGAALARGGSTSKTNMVEPLVEEDLAKVKEGDREISNGSENVDNLPAEDHSSNDPIPPTTDIFGSCLLHLVLFPPATKQPQYHHPTQLSPISPPFNLSGRVTLGKKLQVRTGVQRVEDEEDGHTDDGEEGVELEEQHDDLYNFADTSTMGYDDAIDFAELRASHRATCFRTTTLLSTLTSTLNRLPVRPSWRLPPSPYTPAVPRQTGSERPRSLPDDDHRGRRRTRSVGKSVEAQSLSPPASDQGRLKSELSHSSDDYANEQAQKARVKSRRAAQGDVVSLSVEDEDEEDEREFEKEIETNAFEVEEDERELEEEVERNGFEDEEDEQEVEEEIEDKRPVAKKGDKTKTAEKGGEKKSKKPAAAVEAESGAVEVESGSAAAAGGGGRKTRGKGKGKATMVNSGRDCDCVVGDNGEEDGEDDGEKGDEGYLFAAATFVTGWWEPSVNVSVWEKLIRKVTLNAANAEGLFSAVQVGKSTTKLDGQLPG
ncbi:hypothetical protein B0H19DRAFT_1084900 [Mycena capillaripes]|nr:hypothetical protein B0H19DRAFT_1084900 [Mycena capillaripes]